MLDDIFILLFVVGALSAVFSFYIIIAKLAGWED
jgi:hypothetical protein